MYRPDSLPLCDGRFGLGPVKDLLEFGNAVTHTRVHVSFGTFDVIVQIIAEQLNMGDGGRRHIRIGEVSGKQYKRHVADVFRRLEPRNASQLQRRIAVRVEDLRGILDGRQATSINEFLDNEISVSACRAQSDVWEEKYW